jgi:hypothetical protein
MSFGPPEDPPEPDLSPETKAMFAALHHHVGVAASGQVTEGVLWVDVEPGHVETAHEYIRTMADGLGFRLSSEGRFHYKLRDD